MIKKDNRVTDYINKLPLWQKKLLTNIRSLIHIAEPNIEETIKRENLPYFVCNGNICAFMAVKDHINIFIYDPIAPDPEKIINQGHDNKTARSIQIYESETLKEQAFVNLIKAVSKNNQLGGWRKIN